MRRWLKILFWFGLGVFLTISCLTYDENSLSWNTASSGVINAMGYGGAVISDILIQLFGAVSFLLILFCFSVGLARFQNKPTQKNTLLLIPTVLVGCWLFHVFSSDTLFPTGVGGYTGVYLNQWLPVQGIILHLSGWLLFTILVVYTIRIPMKLILMYLIRFMPVLARFLPIFQKAEHMVAPLKKIQIRNKKKTATAKAKTPVREKPIQQPSNLYQLPPLDLLNAEKGGIGQVSKETIAQTSRTLETILAQFRIDGRIVGAQPGPVVTLYEFEPADGVKAARVISLADDIALKKSASAVRIAVVPESNVIGIEIPNKKRESVYIRELIDTPKFKANTGALPLALGKDIGGGLVYADLAKMPHLLVAGTTGSGKSVAINTMILSLLYRFTPAECRLILVDPKQVELMAYNNIPHLLTPVITDSPKAVVALNWAVREMEDRYSAMSQIGGVVRNIESYNEKLRQTAAEGKKLTRRVQTGFNPETGQPIIEEQQLDLTPWPYIVMIIDEMSDLMGQCRKEAEPPILRLAQKARAVGIHLILATQRPSVDVLTGLIKANVPSRISFQVTNRIDSRTILDEQGAEQLLGRGDMLYRPVGLKPKRVHGPFVSDGEVEKVTAFWRAQSAPQYVEAVMTPPETGIGSFNGDSSADMGEGGDLYDKAVAIILRDGRISTSYVQRQLRIGYNRAADLIDRMEREGVISKPNVAGKREILVPRDNA